MRGFLQMHVLRVLLQISAPFTPPAAFCFQPLPTDAFHSANIGISSRLQFSTSPTIAILNVGLGVAWQSRCSQFSMFADLAALLAGFEARKSRRWQALAATTCGSCWRRWHVRYHVSYLVCQI